LVQLAASCTAAKRRIADYTIIIRPDRWDWKPSGAVYISPTLVIASIGKVMALSDTYQRDNVVISAVAHDHKTAKNGSHSIMTRMMKHNTILERATWGDTEARRMGACDGKCMFFVVIANTWCF
jgi:hypothetical protein